MPAVIEEKKARLRKKTQRFLKNIRTNNNSDDEEIDLFYEILEEFTDEIHTLKTEKVSHSELKDLIHEMRHGFELMEKRFEFLQKEMNIRFDAIDKRFDAVDKRFDAVDKRFETVDKRFETIDKRFDRVYSFMRWQTGIGIALAASILIKLILT